MSNETADKIIVAMTIAFAVGILILGTLAVSKAMEEEAAIEQEEALVVFDGDLGAGGGSIEDRLSALVQEEVEQPWSPWPEGAFIIGGGAFLGEDPQSSITVSELLDRLSSLEKTMEACCGTDTMDPRASGDLELVVKLRMKVEELEQKLDALDAMFQAYLVAELSELLKEELEK